MIELKPCPFCGGDPVFYRSTGRAHKTGNVYSIYSVDCGGCDLTGPRSETRKGAAIAWNRRASGWKKVSDAPIPEYENVIMGLWVYNNRTGKRHFEQYILQYDAELGELWDGDDCFSDWELSDFDVWMPLPPPPDVEE